MRLKRRQMEYFQRGSSSVKDSVSDYVRRQSRACALNPRRCRRLMEYFQRGSSSVKDTVSGSKHTPDFAYARNQYLGSRLRVVCWIFIILSPLLALFDHFLLQIGRAHV